MLLINLRVNLFSELIRVHAYSVLSKRYDVLLNIQFVYFGVSKTFQVIVDEKVLAEQEGKFSDPSFFPLNFFCLVENRTVKFQIKGYQNGQYELEVHGVMYDQLKKPEDPDANDSFD